MKHHSIDKKKKTFRPAVLLAAALCALALSGCGIKENNGGAGKQETARIGEMVLTLPEGYTASATDGLYINDKYPDDQSNIYFYTTEKETDFAQVMEGGREQFEQYLADAYGQQYDERPEIVTSRYEAVSVWSAPAYVVELSYDLQGVHYEQLEYIIDADRTYYVAFSQVGAYSWMDAFRVSAATIFFDRTQE